MKKELIRLLKVLDDTVPAHQMPGQRVIRKDSEMSPECKSLVDHLITFPALNVRGNNFGIECIEDTEIRVFQNLASLPHIRSRYGLIELPVRVRFM